jgi:S1-C subfamily serine protease
MYGSSMPPRSSPNRRAPWVGLDDWAAVIDCPAKDRCDVDAAFVEDLLADLSAFAGDSIRIRPAATSTLGHRGFLFAQLGAESFPAAHGFQAGDVLWQVNGIKLQTLADVGQAFEDLNQTLVLIAQLDREGQTLTQTYRIVPALGER